MEIRDAAEWLLHAESDLIYAKLGQAQAAILRNQVAFHAEQAAEKAFEAVLVHTAVEFPRTHDLQSLLLQLRNSGILVRPEIERASALTRFAVEERYPGTSSRSHKRNWRWRLK
jgi:HEPN domain-containing protein